MLLSSILVPPRRGCASRAGTKAARKTELRDMRSEGAALALMLRASETDFSLPPPTVQAIGTRTSKTWRPSRRGPQTATFFATRPVLTNRDAHLSDRCAAHSYSFAAKRSRYERSAMSIAKTSVDSSRWPASWQRSASGWGWERRLNRSHAPSGVRCFGLALHSGSGPEPATHRRAMRARGEELQANGVPAGPASDRRKAVFGSLMRERPATERDRRAGHLGGPLTRLQKGWP